MNTVLRTDFVGWKLINTNAYSSLGGRKREETERD
jgi:hypothetical protein